ncbi:MAG: hypothetical protein A2158_03850 [Chloroflexi bacterium RBG_13_46_14]|nr:MAG: hypothetical protein A2158_03850 [Chloroflexi bacterium RBG_13_46_14]
MIDNSRQLAYGLQKGVNMKRILLISVILATMLLSACGSPTTTEQPETSTVQETETTSVPETEQPTVTMYTLTTSISPSGAGSISPLAEKYEEDSQVTLTATPASGYTFSSWSGDASGSSPTIAITIDSNKSLVAHFKVVEPEPDVTVDEQVVFEQDGITITVKSLDLKGSFFVPELKVLVENQNAMNITVQVRNVAINDVMVDSSFSCDVVSGKKANDAISFMDSSLETAGIETIKDIEFDFHIFDADSWDTIVDSDTIKIKTSVDDSFMQKYDDSGSIAIDENGIKVVVKKLDSEDSFWGADVLVYVENNTGQDVTIQVRDISINGFMVSPSFSCDVLAGKKAFDSITFFESDLTDNDITIITTIELSFHIFNADTWDTIFDSDAITISFE